MRRKLYCILVMIIFTISGTACFPDSMSDQASLSSEVNIEDAIHSENSDICVSITEEELKAKKQETAYQGITASVHPWNIKDVEQIFSDYINSEIVIPKEQMPIDVRNFISYKLNDGGYLSCSDGNLYFENGEYQNVYSRYLRYYGTITPSACKADFPAEELDGFSKSEALEILQPYIKTLSLPVSEAPYIYAMDIGSIGRLNENDAKFNNTGITEEHDWSKEQEAYWIIYPLQYTDISILPTPFTSSDSKDTYIEGYIQAVVNKEGLVMLNCRNLLDLDKSIAVESSICNAATAVNAVKTNLEEIILPDKITLENLQFGYALIMEDYFSYTLKPVWYLGTYYYQDSPTANGELIPVIVSSIHIVDAETGREYM